MKTPRLLVAESETPDQREERRRSSGKSAGESYAATLRQLRPGAEVTVVAPPDADDSAPAADGIADYDAVFITGAPVHVYEDKPEVGRQLAFMRSVFASGVPSFGSCAGLQLAVAAAGGVVRPLPRSEIGIARRITRTAAGADHPLLAGRPPVWDGATLRGDEVERLPDGAVALAANSISAVQAAEIRHDRGLFWGVQYHPELAPGEIAAALRREAGDLVEQGLADNPAELETQAALLDRLHRDPDSMSARWLLGVDDEYAVEDRRRLELANFLDRWLP